MRFKAPRGGMTGKAKGWVRLALLALLACLPALARAQGPDSASIPLDEQIDLRRKLLGMVNEVLASEIGGGDGESRPAATINLEFDEARLRTDARNFLRRSADHQEAGDKAARDIIDDYLQKMENDVPKAGAAPSAPAEPKIKLKDVPRFGMLNLESGKESIEALINEPLAKATELQGNGPLARAAQPAPQRPSLSVSLQLPAPVAESRFDYKAADYLKKIEVEISLPAALDAAASARLKERIKVALDLKRLAKGANPDDWIKIAAQPRKPMAAVQHTFKSWRESLWSPGNATMPTLAGLLLLCLALLAGSILLGIALVRGLRVVATEVGKLKPEGAAKAVDSGEEEGLPSAKAVKAFAEAGDTPKRDAVASSNAITAEMGGIRTQFKQIVGEQKELLAALLRDLADGDNGLAAVRDLMSFVGFESVKPALDLLPRSLLGRLQEYAEDNRDVATDILRGAEVAQSLYSSYIGKLALEVEENEILTGLRRQLVKVEEELLRAAAGSMRAPEAALILKVLTPERAQRFLKSLPVAVMQESLGMVDNPLPDPAGIAAAIQARLAGGEADGGSSNVQRRLIMRIVKNAADGDEALIAALVKEDDWPLRRLVMQTRFALADARYLPEKLLRGCMLKMDNATRAEIVSVVEPELRTILVGLYKEGTKLREIIDVELDSIAKNDMRKASIEKRRGDLLGVFVAAIRKAVMVDPDVLDDVIAAICKDKNLTPPQAPKASAA